MRTIERTGQFKRDYRRESRGRHRASLDGTLVPIVEMLANDSSVMQWKLASPKRGLAGVAFVVWLREDR